MGFSTVKKKIQQCRWRPFLFLKQFGKRSQAADNYAALVSNAAQLQHLAAHNCETHRKLEVPASPIEINRERRVIDVNNDANLYMNKDKILQRSDSGKA